MLPSLLGPSVPPVIGGTRYAGFWRRLFANFVNVLVFVPVIALHLWLVSLSWTLALLLLWPIAFLFSGYTVYFHARWGQTLGKMAARIRVVQTDGFPLSWKDASIRSAVDIAFSTAMAVGITIALLGVPPGEYESLARAERASRLACLNPVADWVDHAYDVWFWGEVIVLLFNRKKRALHDFMAGTVVIHKGSPCPAAMMSWKGR